MLTISPASAARLLLRVLGGKGSGNFGHEGRPGQIGGSASDYSKGGPPVVQSLTGPLRTPEQRHQQQLAEEQKNPLAHPLVVFGDVDNPGAHRYIAAYGQEFKSAPLPEGIERGDMGDCYKNASLMVMMHPELTYAEGFAKTPNTPFSFWHAWGVTKDGTVVDPTWENPEKCQYFGVKYERLPYLKSMYKAKFYGRIGADFKTAQKTIDTGGSKLRALGGTGSGNFGHSGRPGQIGGSGDSVPNPPDGPDGYSAKIILRRAGYEFKRVLSDIDKAFVSPKVWDVVGKYRVREAATALESAAKATPFGTDDHENVEWQEQEKAKDWVRGLASQLRNAAPEDQQQMLKSVRESLTKLVDKIDSKPRNLGGAGSGNFGHSGRPGQIGGSGEGVKDLPVYHGGVASHGAAVSYHTTNKEMAESYVEMSNDRFGGGGSLHESKITIAHPAPESAVLSAAKKVGIDNDLYTPASAFDSELHGKDAVEELVTELRHQGYDGAVLDDIAYGRQIEDKAYITFAEPEVSAIGDTYDIAYDLAEKLPDVWDEKGKTEARRYLANSLQRAKETIKKDGQSLKEAGKDIEITLRRTLPGEVHERGDLNGPHDYLVDILKTGVELAPVQVGITEHGAHLLDGHRRSRAYRAIGKEPLAFVTKIVPGTVGKSFVRLKISDLKGLGGQGSGNFGHSGRPGERGGSGPGGTDPKSWITSGPRFDALKEKLKVPPNWQDVQINKDQKSHLLVVAKDQKGRTVYKRSAQHSERAAAEKFARLKEFNKELPKIREKVQADLQNPDLPSAEREAAAVLTLIDKTGFRVGSDDETGADVKAYGASTLLARHVEIKGDTVEFAFIGKKGVAIGKVIKDKELAALLKPRVEAGGRLFDVSDDQVRDYLHSRDGDFKVKDFRTWNGTTKALEAIKQMKAPKTEKEFFAAQRAIGDRVAAHLGNTRAVALESYIDPAVWTKWKSKL